jgi:hypothetical protein
LIVDEGKDYARKYKVEQALVSLMEIKLKPKILQYKKRVIW